ncbi:ATP-binding cassette domain-containing protein, partial [Candidatus Woesearchaeota archaeon]|nr:ATP-binding cassette domain-containing protein [Candidatus Woesearchaeota archaeon]
SWEDLIKLYKGTEVYKLLEKIKNGQIKVAYKPQAVDLIVNKSEGKVIDMLRKVDQRNKLDFIVKELTMESILDRELSQLSGGEMQRVAIAATILKEADLYIFDEPASFLDITFRIKAARMIKTLA